MRPLLALIGLLILLSACNNSNDCTNNNTNQFQALFKQYVTVDGSTRIVADTFFIERIYDLDYPDSSFAFNEKATYVNLTLPPGQETVTYVFQLAGDEEERLVLDYSSVVVLQSELCGLSQIYRDLMVDTIRTTFSETILLNTQLTLADAQTIELFR